jgi:hypothetical protein
MFRSIDATAADPLAPAASGDLTIYGFNNSDDDYMDKTMMIYASSGGYSDNIEIAANDPNGVIRFNTAGSLAPHERMRITNTGSVGIGTTTPQAKLDVGGEAKIGISSPALACTSGTAGAMRYNSGQMEYCNGTNWVILGVAPTSASCVETALDVVIPYDEVPRWISCPSDFPYFSALMISREQSGKKSDLIHKYRCCR